MATGAAENVTPAVVIVAVIVLVAARYPTPVEAFSLIVRSPAGALDSPGNTVGWTGVA